MASIRQTIRLRAKRRSIGRGYTPPRIIEQGWRNVKPTDLSAPTKTDAGWVINFRGTENVWRSFETRDAARDAKRALAA